MHPLYLQPLYFRESTLAHYGKRGILYHGACVVWVDVDTGELVLRPAPERSAQSRKQARKGSDLCGTQTGREAELSGS